MFFGTRRSFRTCAPRRRRALRSAAAPAGLAVALGVLLAAAPARGQAPLPVEQVQPPAEDVLAVHAGYEALMRQYSRLRPIASADSAATDTTGAALGLDGLVVDETQTRIGRDFYDAFYRQWQAPEGARGFTVSVQEKPLRGQGILIAVRVNDELAFQARLQPRSDFDAIARQGVAYAYHRLRESGPQIIL